MPNDFEKNISQRMQEFSIAPQPEIWQQVEAALPPEKKRRRLAFWWWLLPLVFLLGGGTWLAVQKQPNKYPGGNAIPRQTPPATTQTTPEKQATCAEDTTSENGTSVGLQKNKEEGREHPPNDAISTTETTASGGNRQAETQNAPLLPTSPKRLGRRSYTSSKKANRLYAGLSTAQAKRRTSDSQPSDLLSGEPEKTVQTDTDSVLTARPDAHLATLAKDTVSSAAKEKTIADSTSAEKKVTDTSIAVNTPAMVAKASGKKAHSYWMAEAGAGQSWQQQITKGNSLSYASQSFNSSPGPATSQPVILVPFASPKTGFSYSLGIVRRQAISSHWNWQLALRYQLLSTKQSYGSMRNATANASYNSLSAARTYNTGDTLVYRNFVHQVQLVPRIEYIINPTAHFPVSIYTGLSVAYNISSNQLLQDYRNHTYLRSAAFSNKWLYTAEVGASVFLCKKVAAGLVYQYGLSNIAKPALQSDFRWRAWQVRVGIPLFHHSSK